MAALAVCTDPPAVGAAALCQPAVLPPAGEGAPVRTLGRMREKAGSLPALGSLDFRPLLNTQNFTTP